MRRELAELDRLDIPDVRDRVGRPTSVSHITLDDEKASQMHRARVTAILVATLVVLGGALYGLSGLGSSSSGAGPRETGSGLSTYVNPMGIKIALDYPSDWSAQSVSEAG